MIQLCPLNVPDIGLVGVKGVNLAARFSDENFHYRLIFFFGNYQNVCSRTGRDPRLLKSFHSARRVGSVFPEMRGRFDQRN